MRKVLIYSASLLLAASVILLLLFHRPERRFDGRITFNADHKIPYGCYVAYHLLATQFANAKVSVNKKDPAEWQFDETDSSGHAMLIVMDYFDPSAEELNTLTAFAQRGNTILISALQMSEDAQQFFKVMQKDAYSRYGISQDNDAITLSDSLVVSLDSTVFSSPSQYSYPGIAYDNQFLSFDTRFTYNLGYNQKGVSNLLGIKTLKGAFYLHSAPIAFTNLFLLSQNNHFYLQKLLTLLPDDTKTVLWDEYFKYRKLAGEQKDKGVLYVLWKYENFRWAFLLTVMVLSLYVLTEVKRKQRLVPQHATPANESLAFVKTVGRLYFERGDHKNLAQKLTSYFLEFIRTHYKIQTAELNADFAKAVSAASTAPLPLVSHITDTIVEIKLSRTITGKQLMQYYKLLETFYRNV